MVWWPREDRAASDTEFKAFIQELQTQAGLHGCTVFLLTTAKGQARPPSTPMVDGILELTDVRYEFRTERALYVNKLRGSGYLPGRHPFRITSEGLEVYPRIEAAFRGTRGPTKPGLAGFRSALRGWTRCLAVAACRRRPLPACLAHLALARRRLACTSCGSSAAEPGLLFGFYRDAAPPDAQGGSPRARP